MTETRTPLLRRWGEHAARARPPVVASVAGIGIAALLILGILQRTVYPTWLLANLDSEASVATWFAAALLWAAAASWILVAFGEQPRRWPVVGWATLLVILALDEGNAFHESLERWLEIDWQILYLPVMALGGWVWWRVVRRHRTSTTSTLLVLGAAAWGIALILELVQNWGGEPVRASIYDPAMVTEEGLEMIGSTLVLLAGLAALRKTRDAGQ